jgi:hypothetical protein
MAPDSQKACVNEAGLVVGWQLLTLPIWDAHMSSNLKPIARKEGGCWMSRTRGIVIGEPQDAHMALDLKHISQLSIQGSAGVPGLGLQMHVAVPS